VTLFLKISNLRGHDTSTSRRTDRRLAYHRKLWHYLHTSFPHLIPERD